jgi:hypothetical protein
MLFDSMYYVHLAIILIAFVFVCIWSPNTGKVILGLHIAAVFFQRVLMGIVGKLHFVRSLISSEPVWYSIYQWAIILLGVVVDVSLLCFVIYIWHWKDNKEVASVTSDD